MPLAHRCTKKVFEQYRTNCSFFIGIGHQYEGIDNKTITIPPTKDILSDCVQAIQYCLENDLKTWQSKDICIMMTSYEFAASAYIVLLYLELKSKFPDFDVLFESKSLSLEWPVVIIIGKI